MSDLLRRVGDNARELREAAGVTQAKAAEALGVDDRYLRRLESGAFNLGLDSLDRLAAFYGVDVQDLVKPRRRPLPKTPRGRPRRGKNGGLRRGSR